MDSEILDRAMAVVSKRRAKAYEEYDRRLSEVNHKIPQIREINTQIFNTGRELIKIIMDKNLTEVQRRNAIDDTERRNKGAQNYSRTLLLKNGYPADYLDIHYTCEKCSDTGYSGNVLCECVKNLYGKISAERLNKSARLELSSFETFRLSYYSGDDYVQMNKILEFTRNYAFGFSTFSKSVLMLGDTGLGKTHLSLAIANEVLQKGFSVVYDSVINIITDISKENFGRGSNSNMGDAVVNSDLLIVDDLGTESNTPFNNSTIYNIINTRLNKSLPTIINTNLNYAGIKERYDSRISSRLSTYTSLTFKGKDIRIQKMNNSPDVL